MSKISCGDHEFEVHPFAERFPLAQDDEFDELVRDIKQQGLLQPITLNSDGTVLIDGRNRLRACEASSRDPVFERLPAAFTQAQVLDYIVSANLKRRHLNSGQAAMLGADYEKFYAAATKAGRPIGDGAATQGNKTEADPPQFSQARAPQSRDRAAKAVGASGRSVSTAKAVQRDAPDLADKVRSGQIQLDAADKERKRRVGSRPKPEPPPKPAPQMLALHTHEGAEVLYPKPSAKATFNKQTGKGISWAAWSWNPVTGCLHGCPYCYAREIATTSDQYKAGYPAGFTPLYHAERLDAPANTVIPAAYRDESHRGCEDGACKICAHRRVFVCSMADLYGRWVPDDWIAAVHQSMLASPQWQYLLLTKFPARYVGLDLPSSAWVGTSVDEQKRVRIAEDAFRKIDGVRVKWLSLEPLREPLAFTDLSMFDWVVIGAQTATVQPDGPVPAFAPPFEWAARIVVQALEAGCKIHMKPNLRSNPGLQWLDQYPLSEDGG